MARPIVAIVGRPNVGKSTLFNRLIGEKKAIMHDLPGTTRDRIYAIASWEGHELTLVDTGGLELKPDSTIRQMVREQVKIAIAEAEVILFMVDAHDGVVPADQEIVDLLYRSEKPVLLVANKVDNPKYQSEVFQFYELGIGDPIPISAYHNRGIHDLLVKVAACLPSPPPSDEEVEAMKIAIVGRPNVGKSMLLNALVGDERAVVDEVPGTTRDAIDTTVSYNGESVVFIDTAGIRRRGRIEQGIEQYSIIRALRAIERADVAILVTDASEGITAQDTHVLGYVQQAYKGVILIVNKWDIAEIQDEAQWTAAIKHRIKFMPHVPILFTSAKTGYGVKNLLPMAKRIYEERSRHISTSKLNNLVKEAVAAHSLPIKQGQRLKIFYATQASVNPPTFVFFVNNAKLLHFSYRRYLENKIRQAFGFQGVPLRLLFKSRDERIAEKI
jgi:GTP-binding protein